METVNLIINLVGFIGLACYIWVLKGQITSQRNILESQKAAIENMKMFVDIFQPEKIHEFVHMREKTFEDQKNQEITKIKKEMEAEVKKESDYWIREFDSAISIILDLIYYVHPTYRKEIFANAPNSHIKRYLLERQVQSSYYTDTYRNALAAAFSEAKKS